LIKAKESRELLLIEGATHVSLCDKKEHVGPAVEKLNIFFMQYIQLKKSNQS
jgi:hypothetical protein